jgi:nucleoside-diphosphate-sugar epimerase
MNGEIYNVGLSNANLTKLELCKVIQTYLPKLTYFESTIGKDPDQRNYIVSNTKIEALGFMPSTTIDHGIKELIKGYEMLNNSIYGNI